VGEHDKVLSAGAVIRLAVLVVALPCLPLLISWRWGWWEAWLYALTAILGFVVSRVLAVRRHPDLFAERARSMDHDNIQGWDRVLAPLAALGGGLLPLVAGLDARLGGSATFSLPARFAALVVILVGYAFSSWALIENRYFSGVVRIQSERGHHVVSSGPYRWIRHPGYAGGLVAYWATPVLLESPWAFLPAAFLTIVLVVRAALEDRTLQDWLEGYRYYAEQVRYRLLPGLW